MATIWKQASHEQKKFIVDGIAKLIVEQPESWFEISTAGKIQWVYYPTNRQQFLPILEHAGMNLDRMVKDGRNCYVTNMFGHEWNNALWILWEDCRGEVAKNKEVKNVKHHYRQTNKQKIEQAKNKHINNKLQQAQRKQAKINAAKKEELSLKKQKQYNLTIPQDKLFDLLSGRMGSFKSYAQFLDYDNLTEQEIISLVEHDYLMIRYIPNPTFNVLVAAISKSPNAKRWIKNVDDKLVKLHKMMWKV